MGKPAGKTLGGKDADHDHRLENAEPSGESYCTTCGRPCLATDNECRMCQGSGLEKRLAYQREQRLLKAVDAALLDYAHRDPEAFKRDLARAEKAEAEAPRVIPDTSENYRNRSKAKMTRLDRAVQERRRVERVRQFDPSAPCPIVKCANESCENTFPKTHSRRIFCCHNCRVITGQRRARARAGMGSDSMVLGVSANGGPTASPAEARDDQHAPVTGRVANDTGTSVEGDQSRVLGSVQGEASRSEEGGNEAMTEKSRSRFTEEQLKHADTQNRPPHNRSHSDIAKELETSQAHLSRMLKEYRAKNNLDEPNLLANRKAAKGLNGTKPAKREKKVTKMPATIEVQPKPSWQEAVDFTVKKLRSKRSTDAISELLVERGFEKRDADEIISQAKEKHVRPPRNRSREGSRKPQTALASRPKPSGKIIGISLEGVIADAERAKGELDHHKGECPDCKGKVSSNALCMIGRAYSSRWARLEFIAASA